MSSMVPTRNLKHALAGASCTSHALDAGALGAVGRAASGSATAAAGWLGLGAAGVGLLAGVDAVPSSTAIARRGRSNASGCLHRPARGLASAQRQDGARAQIWLALLTLA